MNKRGRAMLWRRERAKRFVRILKRACKRDTPEERLWCAVLCRAIEDTATQHHQPEWWQGESLDTIAHIINLRGRLVRRWARRAGLI